MLQLPHCLSRCRLLLRYCNPSSWFCLSRQLRLKSWSVGSALESGLAGHEVGNAEYMFLDDDAFIKVSEWWIAFDSIKGHIHDQGSWARDAFAALSAEDQDATLRDIAVFSVNLVDGLNQVRAERDSNNDAREEDSPPVFPLELAALRPRDFISCVLDPRRDHLAKFWTPDEIENVERDHNSLFKAYNDGL